jgi:hypothetical protein
MKETGISRTDFTDCINVSTKLNVNLFSYCKPIDIYHFKLCVDTPISLLPEIPDFENIRHLVFLCDEPLFMKLNLHFVAMNKTHTYIQQASTCLLMFSPLLTAPLRHLKLQKKVYKHTEGLL